MGFGSGLGLGLGNALGLVLGLGNELKLGLGLGLSLGLGLGYPINPNPFPNRNRNPNQFPNANAFPNPNPEPNPNPNFLPQPHSPFPVPRSPFLVPLSSFPIRHVSNIHQPLPSQLSTRTDVRIQISTSQSESSFQIQNHRVWSRTRFMSLLRRRTIREKSPDVTQATVKHTCHTFIYILRLLFCTA